MLVFNKFWQGFTSNKSSFADDFPFVAFTHKKIDALVYQLYGLTGEEIQLIENA